MNWVAIFFLLVIGFCCGVIIVSLLLILVITADLLNLEARIFKNKPITDHYYRYEETREIYRVHFFTDWYVTVYKIIDKEDTFETVMKWYPEDGVLVRVPTGEFIEKFTHIRKKDLEEELISNKVYNALSKQRT